MDNGADWLRQEKLALAAVTAAARAGQLRVFRSFELFAEALRGQSTIPEIRGDLWLGIHFEHVDNPVDRSRLLGSLTHQDIASREHQQSFFDYLLELARDHNWRHRVRHSGLTHVELQNVARLPEFAALCEAAGPTRWADAFHFWTALCSDLDYFLTTDRKFVNAMRESDIDASMICRIDLPHRDAIRIA